MRTGSVYDITDNNGEWFTRVHGADHVEITNDGGMAFQGRNPDCLLAKFSSGYSCKKIGETISEYDDLCSQAQNKYKVGDTIVCLETGKKHRFEYLHFTLIGGRGLFVGSYLDPKCIYNYERWAGIEPKEGGVTWENHPMWSLYLKDILPDNPKYKQRLLNSISLSYKIPPNELTFHTIKEIVFDDKRYWDALKYFRNVGRATIGWVKPIIEDLIERRDDWYTFSFNETKNPDS